MASRKERKIKYRIIERDGSFWPQYRAVMFLIPGWYYLHDGEESTRYFATAALARQAIQKWHKELTEPDNVVEEFSL
jgi:hypothetical protein